MERSGDKWLLSTDEETATGLTSPLLVGAASELYGQVTRRAEVLSRQADELRMSPFNGDMGEYAKLKKQLALVAGVQRSIGEVLGLNKKLADQAAVEAFRNELS